MFVHAYGLGGGGLCESFILFWLGRRRRIVENVNQTSLNAVMHKCRQEERWRSNTEPCMRSKMCATLTSCALEGLKKEKCSLVSVGRPPFDSVPAGQAPADHMFDLACCLSPQKGQTGTPPVSFLQIRHGTLAVDAAIH